MGCISSKAITRSMSIREELSHGFQSRSTVWEDLLTSHSGTDQLFAFVCSSNTNTNTTKLKTSSFTLPSTDAWDVINAETPPAGQPEYFTRSKSCHTPRENRLDLEDKKMGGSRSFHTVEEYDALLERIRGTTTSFPWDDENETISRDEDDVINEVGERETGWKRKAIGRGLKSLDISSTTPQRMLEQGQIYSPGTYVTPKFGTYNAPAMPHQENTVFSPELVAAFEDCMQQLQLDEDSILRHMEEENEFHTPNRQSL